MADKKDEKPIIYVKKVIKKADHGSHGGSWKIAYADFVTAMMAFFMLMWLVNVASEEQKKGIADYFALNFINTHSRNGGAGMMQGINVSNANNSNGKGTEPSPIEKPESNITEEANGGMPSNIPDPNNSETSSASKGGEDLYDSSKENSKNLNQKKNIKKSSSLTNAYSSSTPQENTKNKNTPQQKSANNNAPKSDMQKAKGLDAKIASQMSGKKESSDIYGSKNSNGENKTTGEKSHQGDSVNAANKTQTPGEQVSSGKVDAVGSQKEQGQDIKQGPKKIPGKQISSGRVDVIGSETQQGQNVKQGLSRQMEDKKNSSGKVNIEGSQSQLGKDVKQGASEIAGKKVSSGKVDVVGSQTEQGQDIKQGASKIVGKQTSSGKVDVVGSQTEQGQDVKQGSSKIPGEQASAGKVDVVGSQTEQGQDIKQGYTLTEEEKQLLKTIQDSEHEKAIIYSVSRANKNKELKNIEKEKLEKLYKEENESLEKLAHELLSKVSKDPETSKMLPNLIVELTSEGLKIQIIDQYKKPMFEKGSSQVSSHTKKLLGKIGEIIQESTKKVIISGHTDATPYSGTEYTNWELSSDRANATRKQFVKMGVSSQRFESVIGREASDPLIKNDPYAPQNRRISITLLRDIPSAS